ncbi:Hypothetical predicted protein [Xyrichtys novacula]|uniref:Uncharacterized protein n=1 Tax=Xyrichtys novacula TaxID=13765 RepID=A0AAV1HAZ0_XYRNO|nr:Hypothetical predicted protein [Xyrichtys novacula]
MEETPGPLPDDNGPKQGSVTASAGSPRIQLLFCCFYSRNQNKQNQRRRNERQRNPEEAENLETRTSRGQRVFNKEVKTGEEDTDVGPSDRDGY